MMLDFIAQTLGTVLLFYGIYECGNVRVRGPASAYVAEMILVYVGVTHSTWSLCAIGTGLAIVQMRTLCKWVKEGKPW